MERWLRKCGELLDGDPSVESVDIGTFGTWGEGHTWRGSMRSFPPEVIRQHIDCHIRAFPHTPLVMNYGMLTHVFDQQPQTAKWLAEYAVAMGMGLRDDSIHVSSYVDDFNYDTLSAPDLFLHYADRVPVNIEFGHYDFREEPNRFCNGYPHIEALRHTGATYAGFHGYVTHWLEDQKPLHDYLANRLGYWYFIEGYTLPPLMSGTVPSLTLRISNRGFARAYFPCRFKARLVCTDKTIFPVCSASANNENWEADKTADASFRLDLAGVPAGDYELQVGLFAEETAIRIGMTQAHFRDGYYAIGRVTVSDGQTEREESNE